MNDFIENTIKASLRRGWFRNDAYSQKRYKAVENFFLKADLDVYEVLNALPPITIFTPSLLTFGQALTIRGGPMVYLCPNLEFESQKYVDFVVAHEFAHIALRHHVRGNEQMAMTAEKYENRPAEKAADALAVSWGFKRPRGKSRFAKMVVAFGNSKALSKNDPKSFSEASTRASSDESVESPLATADPDDAETVDANNPTKLMSDGAARKILKDQPTVAAKEVQELVAEYDVILTDDEMDFEFAETRRPHRRRTCDDNSS